MSIKQRIPKCKLNPILLAKLQKLCRLRWCNHFLPDTDTGRAMLIALLRFGLADENAIECAPWCEAAELATLKRRARRIGWRDVGKVIGLTFKEWKRAKLFILRPVDASESDIEAWREERRKVSARDRQAKRREKQKMEKESMMTMARPQTPRQKAILEILLRGYFANPMLGLWRSVPELMKEAQKLPEFAGVRNLRDAIHETLDQLEHNRIVKPHTNRPVRKVMLNIWLGDAKAASEALDSGVGLSDPAFEQKARKVNDLAENGTCHAPIEDMGSVTQKNPAPVSKPEAPEIMPPTPSERPRPLAATRNNVDDVHFAKPESFCRRAYFVC